MKALDCAIVFNYSRSLIENEINKLQLIHQLVLDVGAAKSEKPTAHKRY